MDRQLAQEIIACLSNERNLYYYYRDRYSIGLLRHLSQGAEQGVSIAELKQSHFAPLLQKPRVKAVMATLGKGKLTESDWYYHDHDSHQQAFVLTFGVWGDGSGSKYWKQTSRPGCNLVLQMNFSNEHDLLYEKLKAEEAPFGYQSHPISDKRHTLAWARIDLDLQRNCALIEEIQNDWLRDVLCLQKRITSLLKRGETEKSITNIWGITCSLGTAQRYCRFVLERYAMIWDEAMLWAAISFLREEVGIRDIFYHSVDSGRLLKSIAGNLPPRSVYTDLPKRFCFMPTQETPEFLHRESSLRKIMKKHPTLTFFKMPTL